MTDAVQAPATPAAPPDPIRDAFAAEFERLRPAVERGELPSSARADEPQPSLAAPPPLAGDFDYEPGALQSFERTAGVLGITANQASQLLSWYAMWSERAAADPDGALPLDVMETALKNMARQIGIKEETVKQLREWHDKADWRGRQREDEDTGGPTPAQQKAIEALRHEWGETYDANLQAAKSALRQHGGDEMLALLEETGLGDDPRMIRAWARIGAANTGERPTGQQPSQSQQPNAQPQSQSPSPWRLERGEQPQPSLSPHQAASADQAKREIASVMNDPKHPYFNPTHPGNAEAKEKVRQLHETAYPDNGIAFTLR